MKKISHVQSTKSEMLLNAIAVQVEFGYSEEEYYGLIYELGVEFIQEIFPSSQKAQACFLYDKTFWSWWRLTFFNWEKELINFFHEYQEESTRAIYELEMQVLAHDSSTESKFQNILKIKHGQSITA